MKTVRIANGLAAVIGYLALLCLGIGMAFLARSGYQITLEPSMDARSFSRTVEQTGKAKRYYPNDVFAERKPPAWTPGAPLPLDANQAMQIATNSIVKERPEYSRGIWLAQTLALKHATDQHWYYEYEAWVRPESGQPSAHVSASVLMDGSLWGEWGRVLTLDCAEKLYPRVRPEGLVGCLRTR
jgi:hypothetical protein